ncbi:MFS transporter [Flammeovirga kamogawensis]|uniref:MFS transporter n=1 Tax=Flammeovirga kamogawensis TaxID=373891 RepID=A0ABX8GV69_9BACT|nr:MFS transporter [Flammeovirga kamogawensis]MBB6459717.1 putative MFS family arabinose efflux permease [Flammeovirga kamogawensis]QWG07223.1 MFS transporter [Flammeovirga kamogawensis]TRX69043.1 MFS transporter [Flammeovirga kamogawensis]
MTLTKNEKVTLYMLAAVSFTNILDFIVLMPLGHVLQETFEMTPVMWSAVVSSYTLAAAVSGLISIFIIDRFERKRMFLTIYAFFTIGTLLCSIAPTYHFLLLARLFTGVFGGLINAALFTIVGDMLPEEKRGTGIGILMTGFAVSSAIGVPIGLYLGVEIDWHAPFLIIGCIASVLWIVCYKRLPTMNAHLEHRKDPNENIKLLAPFTELLSNKRQQQGLLALGFVFFGHFLLIPFFSPYMVNNIGFEDSQLTWIYLCGGICTMYFSPRIGVWSDKYGKYLVFTIISCITVLPTLVLTNTPTMSIPFVLVFSSLFFICGARSIPANALLLGTSNPKKRGSFMSVRSSVQNLSQGLASFASGYIIYQDPTTGVFQHYNRIGIISVIATMLGVFLFKKISDTAKHRARKLSLQNQA